MIVPVRINGRGLRPHKATISPQLGALTVLTKSPWEFVALWLKRHNQEDALFYWNQAQQFSRASVGLDIQSAPLLHYYSFLNATKALLTAKGTEFLERHGISDGNISSPSPSIDITNERVKIHDSGVLPSLSRYLGDSETNRNHSLQDLLFNLPYIHRTYCLTYRDQSNMFIPLRDCQYVFDSEAGKVFLSAKLSAHYSDAHHMAMLPATLTQDHTTFDECIVRSVATAEVESADNFSTNCINNLISLNKSIHQDLNYINGIQTLWYAKANVVGPARLNYSPLTTTLAAMHRLSEICRYRPLQLARFLSGDDNWLICEFITMAPEQFLDYVAAEITGHQFMLPNVRPAT